MKRSFVIIMLIMFSTVLYAEQKTAVLKLCTTMKGEPFMLSTEDEKTAVKLGFKKYKDTATFIRDFRILVDNEPNTYFKPVSENCITVYRIDPGKKTVSIDFKSLSYTALEARSSFTATFKSDLLYNAGIEIVEGPTATVRISQYASNISLYQALEHKEVPDCEKECKVPVGIPVYFMTKGTDEKVKCPVQFELIVNDEKDSRLECYQGPAIKKMLEEHVAKNNILCRINLEYAFFKVYGEGCIVTIEADRDGLNYEAPEIKLYPLEKQKFKYFWKINSEETKPYTFSGDRKGPEKTPAENDIIEIIEERNN